MKKLELKKPHYTKKQSLGLILQYAGLGLGFLSLAQDFTPGYFVGGMSILYGRQLTVDGYEDEIDYLENSHRDEIEYYKDKLHCLSESKK